MHAQIEVYVTMSTHGPWEVLKTDHGTYKVVSGGILVADCPKLWDAEFIVYLHNHKHEIRSLQEQVAQLKEKIEILEHGND